MLEKLATIVIQQVKHSSSSPGKQRFDAVKNTLVVRKASHSEISTVKLKELSRTNPSGECVQDQCSASVYKTMVRRMQQISALLISRYRCQITSAVGPM